MDRTYIYAFVSLLCVILIAFIISYIYYESLIPNPTLFTKINMTKEPKICNDNINQSLENFYGKWIITVDDANLVFKDVTTEIKNGYYFDLNGRVNYGNKNYDPNTINYTNDADESGHIMTFGNWIMAEDNGKFVIYNNGVSYYARYTFYPNSGVVTFGKGTTTDKNSCTIATGKRWVVKVDNGYLTFLDIRSTGDNRYVFCPGYGVDINNKGINLVNMRKTEML